MLIYFFFFTDPKLKARIKEQLANTQSPHYVDIESPINIYDYSSSPNAASPKNQRQNQNQYQKGATTPTNASSPALRYKSPTHLPSLRQNSPTATAITSIAAASTTTTIHTHSRNSSASSTKIQMVESTTITTSISNSNIATSPTAAGSGATSPTFRPSRIPQALKSVAPKPVPQVQSPQHKRPRPSQIPTKAANGNGNGLQPLQHSNSYSGSPAVTRQRHAEREPEPEPNSAPPQPAKAPRFEAYMMTGDLILNLSRTPQSSNLITTQAKKVMSANSLYCLYSVVNPFNYRWTVCETSRSAMWLMHVPMVP